MDLSGKAILVTGGSRGLGRRLVERFATAGAAVAFCSRRYVDLAPIESKLLEQNPRVMAQACDVRLEDEVVRFVHRVVQRFGRIDAVVNNAAVPGPRVPIVRYPLDPWRDVLDTNLTGAYLVCREAIPTLFRNGGGAIINVTDGVPDADLAERGAYLASKWGIEGLTRMLAAELRPANIRVNVVDPGPNSQERPETPDSIDELRLDLFAWLASDAARHITGRHISAIEPGVIERLRAVAAP